MRVPGRGCTHLFGVPAHPYLWKAPEALMTTGTKTGSANGRLLRPPARPHRVLHARRRRAPRRAGPAHRRPRHAGGGDDRPRQRVRCLRLLQEGEGRGGQADHRHGGVRRPQHLALRAQGRQLLRRRPRRRLGARRVHPHDPALGDHRGHAQPLPPLSGAWRDGFFKQPRIDRELLPSTARASSRRPAARRARSRSTCATATTTRPGRRPPTTRTSSVATATSWS